MNSRAAQQSGRADLVYLDEETEKAKASANKGGDGAEMGVARPQKLPNQRVSTAVRLKESRCRLTLQLGV